MKTTTTWLNIIGLWVSINQQSNPLNLSSSRIPFSNKCIGQRSLKGFNMNSYADKNYGNNHNVVE
jgi:hypothetical protein